MPRYINSFCFMAGGIQLKETGGLQSKSGYYQSSVNNVGSMVGIFMQVFALIVYYADHRERCLSNLRTEYAHTCKTLNITCIQCIMNCKLQGALEHAIPSSDSILARSHKMHSHESFIAHKMIS